MGRELMRCDRRTFTLGAALLCLCNNSILLAAPASAAAINNLQDFLISTVGKPEADREAAARRMLDKITPLDVPTLLVEIAAIGTLVRSNSTSVSLREGYPKRSREALDMAEKKLASEGWTKALGGAWHYEVVRRSRIGAMLYGASRQKGDALFAEAAKVDPDDPGIRLTEAVALLGTKDEAATKRASSILNALPARGASAYTQLVAAQAAQLAQLLRSGRTDEAQERSLAIF